MNDLVGLARRVGVTALSRPGAGIDAGAVLPLGGLGGWSPRLATS
jgi:hypothetical protein